MESGDRTQRKITRPQLIELLTQKINSVSFGNIRKDIIRFIPDARVVDIWSPKYFTDLIQKIRTNL